MHVHAEMKLKVKHISNNKEAYRVEVPNGCCLAELKQALVEQLQVLPSASPADVVVSLNKKVRSCRFLAASLILSHLVAAARPVWSFHHSVCITQTA